MPSGVPLTGVSVGLNADGHVEVFAVGADLAIWHRRETSPVGAWGAWASLGKPAPALPVDRPAVAANLDGRLELFTVARDGTGGEA